MTSLCVGCGALQEGDVNVDVQKQSKGNFALADSLNLPFTDNSFTEVTARHCLEHMSNPLQALKEMNRVCNGKVYVYIPSEWQRDVSPEHIYSWSPIELANIMRKAGFRNVKADYTRRVYRWTSKKTTLVNFIVKIFGFYTEIIGIGEK